MSASSSGSRSGRGRLNTFEILCLILEAVDRGLVPAGATGVPSFRRIWAGLTSPIERGRWEYAWDFVRDEEIVEIEAGNRPQRWRLSKEGRILLRELRLGAFSSLKNIRHPGDPGRRSSGFTRGLGSPLG